MSKKIYNKFRIVKKVVPSEWHIIDAADKVLGRLASKLAGLLSGKHKVRYVPYLDEGDYCIVINASKVLVTGRKNVNKKYFYHTGYPGGIKSCTFYEMLIRSPQRVIEIAVKGMLPKGPLGRMMYNRLKVYSGSNHPHFAQKPIMLDMKDIERSV